MRSTQEHKKPVVLDAQSHLFRERSEADRRALRAAQGHRDDIKMINHIVMFIGAGVLILFTLVAALR